MAEVKLKCGVNVLVDKQDLHFFDEYKFHVTKGRVVCTPYKNGKKTTIQLSRLILNVKDPKIHVDHAKHNTLDNRRSKIRITTPSQNQMNRLKMKTPCTSKYKGVFRDKIGWIATFNHKHIGKFYTEIEAAIAYDKKAIKYFGEYACLNFPDGIPETKHYVHNHGYFVDIDYYESLSDRPFIAKFLKEYWESDCCLRMK